MAGRALRYPRRHDRGVERALHRTLVQVVALPAPVGGGVGAGRGKQVLPTPVELHAGVFPPKRVVHPAHADAGAPIAGRPRCGLLELGAQWHDARSRQRRSTVLAPLATTDDDLAPIEIDVLDPQAHALQDTKT